MKRKIITRAIAARAFVCLFVGTTVNMALAWACCLRFGADDASARFTIRPPTVSEMNWWRESAPEGVREPLQAEDLRSVGCHETRLEGGGPIINNRDGTQTEFMSNANYVHAGFPLRSLRGEWFAIPDPSTQGWRVETSGAVYVPMGPTFSRRVPVFPWRPLWPGFAISTVLYATVCWVLLATPEALRRRRRIKRGLCPACAYPVGDSSVCTECGKPVKPKGITA